MHSNKMQSPVNSTLSVPLVNGHPVRSERRDLRAAMAEDGLTVTSLPSL